MGALIGLNVFEPAPDIAHSIALFAGLAPVRRASRFSSAMTSVFLGWRRLL
jgi:hypothetical protein